MKKGSLEVKIGYKTKRLRYCEEKKLNSQLINISQWRFTPYGIWTSN